MQHNPFIHTSNGKLLLTGEYLVLRGATALALPLTLTQSIEVHAEEANGHPVISWHAFTPSKTWMKVLFELPELNIIYNSLPESSAKLQIILLTLRQFNPVLFDGTRSYKIITRLGFEPEWGLGTSSTLIANLAKWASVDPFTVLRYSIGGSGYDIAAASAASPIFYKLEHQLKAVVQKANFTPEFSSHLYFVYRGNKKDSAKGIHAFNNQNENRDLGNEIEAVNEISAEAARTHSYERFCTLMNLHESIMSELLGLPVLKESFPGFDGNLKNLGAWGGDFMLAMSERGEEYVRNFFRPFSGEVVFCYNDIVRQTQS